MFFSPYSISTALAMTYAGARGNTEKEMASTLCFSMKQENLRPVFASMEERMNKLQNAGYVQLSVANYLLWAYYRRGEYGYCLDGIKASNRLADRDWLPTGRCGGIKS